MTIQWYPGHMAKAKRLMQEDLKLIDVAVELLDARIPASSRNPEFEAILAQKPRVFLLNKADLADQGKTKEWIHRFNERGMTAVPVDTMSGAGIKQVIQLAGEAARERMEQLQRRGRRPRAMRIMIVGIPNVGKSSLINKLVGKSSAKTGDKPGVTRGRQWIRIANQMELLDTPGVLWPKFENEKQGYHLALTGAISDDLFDWVEVATYFISWLMQAHFSCLQKRYGLQEQSAQPQEVLAQIGAKRGCVEKGGSINLEKAAYLVLQEYRSGILGRFTLESSEQMME